MSAPAARYTHEPYGMQETLTGGEWVSAADYEALLIKARAQRRALEDAQHGVGCPGQPGWLLVPPRTNPCTCGLTHALTFDLPEG